MPNKTVYLYKVVKNRWLDELEKEVTALLNDGWKICGNMTFTFGLHNSGCDQLYFQPLMKETSE